MTRPIELNIKIIRAQKPKYSIEHPNPEWNIKGENWINFSVNNWKDDKNTYDVAIMPNVPVEIIRCDRIHNVLPKKCGTDIHSNPANLYMGGIDGRFWLKAFRMSGVFAKGENDIVLYPSKDEDREIILYLFKIAEHIYDVLERPWKPVSKV